MEYLQRRNPNVPGVIDKLYPPQERKLEDIQKYWKLIMTVSPVVEICMAEAKAYLEHP